MTIEDLKNRLNTLYTDLTVTGEEALRIINRYNLISNDKKKLIDDFYFKENSPVRVLNTVFEPKGNGDVTAEMLDLSLHYDEFIDRLREQIMQIIERHEIALRLFFIILEMKSDYSDILYLRYYKCHTTEETWDILKMTRTSFFRYHAVALELLRTSYTEKYESDQ